MKLLFYSNFFMPSNSPKKIYLIDGNSFIYRMFFWLPEFSTKDWKVVNAIFGMAKFFVHQLTRENPDYVVFITDAPWKNFRDEIYSEYKATRDRMPDNLKSQIDGIHEIISHMWIDIISIPWYEADDVIWTLAHTYSWNLDYEVDILSWDKDLYSLISKNVVVYDTMKRKKFWIDETKEKFWVTPDGIIDFLAIVWDKADNIPWIDWFWPKKAVGLINEIWNIDAIYSEVKKVESWEKLFSDYEKSIQSCFKGKTFEKLVNSEEDAILSKKLATIALDVSLDDFQLDNYMFHPKELLTPEVKELFRSYEFFSLLWESSQKKLQKWEDLKLKVNIVGDSEWLDEIFTKIGVYKNITLDTETTSLKVMEAELVWISIYLDDENIFYINRLHDWPQVWDSELKDFINKIFKLDITIIGHNLKYDLEIIELFLWKDDRQSPSSLSKVEEHNSQLWLWI